MYYWPFGSFRSPSSCTEAHELESKMADQVKFVKRVRKSLYYGEYSDASLPSLSVTDVAVEVLNNTVPPRNRFLDRKYAHSVARRAKISPCTLMMGMLYAERLRKRNPHGTINLNSSDVFLISIMVASKYLYDEGEEEEVYNEDWAKAGCKTVKDINKLEMDFLQLMDWNLFISKDEFLSFVNQVESRVAVNKGCARGWLTYSDMCTLLNNTILQNLLQEIRQQLFKNISKCLAAYMLGVSILLGSSTLAIQSQGSVQQDTISACTTGHPSFNCLVTEASVFSCERIEAASPELSHDFLPIALTIRRAQGSFFLCESMRNETGPEKQLPSVREIPEKNHTFTGFIKGNDFTETSNCTPQNPKTRTVYNDQHSNNNIGELSAAETEPQLCFHSMNETTRNSLSEFGPQNSNKGCFEEFYRNHKSSREWSCIHRQQVCIA